MAREQGSNETGEDAGGHARRRFLTLAAGASAGALTGIPYAHAGPRRDAQPTDFPFTLGVASGDPLPDSVVLWTRLAPRPFEPGGGLPPAGTVQVHWEIAEDEGFRRTGRTGLALAEAANGYSVHADVRGLRPGRDYWYRFRAGAWTSPVGRTRTAPAADATPSRLRIGLASCQQYDEGYFTAHAHLAREELDAVFFVGDYIYENAIDPQAGDRGLPAGSRLPEVFGHETVTLEDYRLRYALAKSDPDLQAAHAAHPWCVTWDDHEVSNNYAAEIPQAGEDAARFPRRRAAAYQAYWENMPLRRDRMPQGRAMDLYRRLSFGRLAQFDVLDTRQYRSDQAYGDGWQYPGPASQDPARTLTGDRQERWLLDGFRASTATWNVLSQQVAFSRRRLTAIGPSRLSMDAWDGYPASRQRVLDGARAAGVGNLVVFSGDSHIHLAMDIKKDFDDPRSAVLGVEILGTSISSGGDGMAKPEDWASLLAANPHMSYYAKRRGYVVVTLTPTHARADYRTLPYVTRPGAPVATETSLVTEAGKPGFHPA
ncbi:alkaline phosphatase [Streptomyces eurocidicus]|uniref:Alkaline phosphatase n=1 Tax=Streptomyces eurocidicus TaxID=66423 RepID=A0A2N8P093_STREU|nr:alkaline phosphatase D family protein [Streptomyces eurocidicus]MBB5121754.1 alkaline phosphatase D [Streptomyces eurocidicus]MBF6052969.1 alkaline phosphatase [Streptomyces eurocidicus]PNE34442.1 alkaline phosphatase [Streptomyces eurocidicus]